MNITKTNFVEAHYKLQESNDEGEVIENNFEGEPLGFVFGVGMMIPGFEEHIEGLSVGDKKGFKVASEDAYGAYIEENVIDLPLANFGTQEDQAEVLKIGNPIAMQDQGGQQHQGIVKSVNEETASIDFNHPMAGKDLFFYVEIKNIRETTDEELTQMGLVFE